MSVLLLRLAGPLQSWGDHSRFARRETRAEPTKSGVLGMLAAAAGRRRTDPVEDLAQTRFGVRVDQPGETLRDYHTAQNAEGDSMPLSERYYLSDAVFVAAVEGDDALIVGLEAAVRAPSFPLFLGRRACPPAGQVSLGLRAGPLEAALRAEPWHAAAFHRRRVGRTVQLPLIRDADGPHEEGDVVRDVPVSFDPERRQYGWRTVVRVEPVTVDNPQGRADEHDPFAVLGWA